MSTAEIAGPVPYKAKSHGTGKYIMAVLLIVFGFYVVYPITLIFIQSFNAAGIIAGEYQFSFANWVKAFADPAIGLQPYQARQLAFSLGLTGDQVGKAVKMFLALYKAFIATDASMIEINPLIVTGAGDLIALDAKVTFDDNALYRHPAFKDLRDLSEEDPLEIDASKYSLNYIKLDGTIGCMVNGAGLAMATMDIIKLYGLEPANFLDVGGSATKDKVAAAFKIITSDPKVKGILVNIFGGIMKCDVIAEGVVAAVKEVGLKVPLVVRLEGTNVDLGKKIIKESGLNVTSGDDLDDAAQKIVAAVKKGA